MIVYYDPENGNLLGMSYKIDPAKTQHHFETFDPIAEKIFLGQEKITRYYAVVKSGPSRQGFLKLKHSNNSNINNNKNRIVKIKQNLDSAELTVAQDTVTKTVTLSILPSTLAWWELDQFYSKKKCIIVACALNNPFVPYWSKSFSYTDFETGIVIPYTGSDNITFYTTRLFDSYKHEVKPI
jgi:hypothetical protein